MKKNELNESQQKAVDHFQGPCMVLAGPGSGKTTVLTERIKKLIMEHDILSGQILVITFTKAAAMEMKERFQRKMNGQKTAVTFGTFHAVFFQILKHAYGFRSDNILRENEKYQILGEVTRYMELDYEEENEFYKDLLGEISLQKNSMETLDEFHPTVCEVEKFREIYVQYEKKLHLKKKIDFDDMLVYTYELLSQRQDICQAWQQKFQYILIDEFQDINQLQFQIIRLLALPQNHLFVVGDDDQSIYRFRGARPEIMLNFTEAYTDAQKILLNINYRSSRKIVESSLTLISKNMVRFQKEIKANSTANGTLVMEEFSDPLEEADAILSNIQKLKDEQISYSEIAVLFRSNSQMRILVAKLIHAGVPFQSKERLPILFEHWIAEDLFAYFALSKGMYLRKNILRVMNHPNRFLSRDLVNEETINPAVWKQKYMDQSWMRERIDRFFTDVAIMGTLSPFAAINYVRKGIGYDEFIKEFAKKRGISDENLMEILEQLQEHAKGFKTFEEWEKQITIEKKEWKENRENRDDFAEGITLSTLHGAKGLEYEAVFILDVNETIIPYKKAALDAEIEEERRMFYVGMTRAKSHLYLYSVREYHNHKMNPSRFLTELQKA